MTRIMGLTVPTGMEKDQQSVNLSYARYFGFWGASYFILTFIIAFSMVLNTFLFFFKLNFMALDLVLKAKSGTIISFTSIKCYRIASYRSVLHFCIVSYPIPSSPVVSYPGLFYLGLLIKKKSMFLELSIPAPPLHGNCTLQQLATLHRKGHFNVIMQS